MTTKKRNLASYSVADKLEFVKKFKEGNKSAREFGLANNIGKSTILDWVKEFNEGKFDNIRNSSIKKLRMSLYPEVEDKLVQYIELRKSLYSRDKCGLSWQVLKDRATKIAKEILPPNRFNSLSASNGWITATLNRHRLIGVRLHGEASEMSVEMAEQTMHSFRVDLQSKMDAYNVPKERVWNADQSGLYFQKLPNRMYCKPEERATMRGVKQMKDKTRITLMICTSAGGGKIPLAVIGKSARPQCWDLCNDKPPLPYKHQTNAWFDKNIMIWWLNEVFGCEMKKRYGNNKVILLLDNCSAHVGIDAALIPNNVILHFFPPNLTARYQPADQGIIIHFQVQY